MWSINFNFYLIICLFLEWGIINPKIYKKKKKGQKIKIFFLFFQNKFKNIIY